MIDRRQFARTVGMSAVLSAVAGSLPDPLTSVFSRSAGVSSDRGDTQGAHRSTGAADGRRR